MPSPDPCQRSWSTISSRTRANLLPETRELWQSAGGRTAGSWEEVFGKGTGADEAFMAWHYARFMNRMAELGKKEYPLPVFVNAWLGEPPNQQPGEYPSGGPQAHNHDFWRAGAPQIDVLAPDIYASNFADVARLYSRNGNPLFIPETRDDAGNAFLAIGQLNAQMFSPFGIERRASPDSALAKAYDVLGQLTPLIVEHQVKGTMRAVLVPPRAPAATSAIGELRVRVRRGRQPFHRAAGPRRPRLRHPDPGGAR